MDDFVKERPKRRTQKQKKASKLVRRGEVETDPDSEHEDNTGILVSAMPPHMVVFAPEEDLPSWDMSEDTVPAVFVVLVDNRHEPSLAATLAKRIPPHSLLVALAPDVKARGLLGFEVCTHEWTSVDVLTAMEHGNAEGTSVKMRYAHVFRRVGTKNDPQHRVPWHTAFPKFLSAEKLQGGFNLLSETPCVIRYDPAFPHWFMELSIVIESVLSRNDDESRPEYISELKLVDLCRSVDMVDLCLGCHLVRRWVQSYLRVTGWYQH